MNYIRLGSNNLWKLSTAWERPFITTVPPVDESRWIGEAVEASGEEPHAGQGAFAGACGICKTLPWAACPMRFARDFNDIRILRILAADDKLGIVPKTAESAEEIPGGAFGAAALVSCIDLDYF